MEVGKYVLNLGVPVGPIGLLKKWVITVGNTKYHVVLNLVVFLK
jgi:hypothetical protein